MDEVPDRQAEPVGEHGARRALEVALGQRTEVEQPAAGAHVVEDPLLHGGGQVAAGREGEYASWLGVALLQVHGAEAEAAQQQRAGEEPALPRAPVVREVVDDLAHRRRAGVVVLGGVRVEHQAELDPVVLLVHPGQPVLLRRHRAGGAGSGVEGEAALALRTDRRGRPVPLAGEAEPVVAVAHDLLQWRVDAAGEEVVVDQPVALGDAEAGLEVDRRRVVLALAPAAVVAGAGLELQRGQGLVVVVHGVHERVHDVEVGEGVRARGAEVVVGPRDHPGDAGVGAHQLADPDRERRSAAVLGPVDVDQERDVSHVARLGEVAERGDVRREAVAHVLGEVDAHPGGDRLRR